MGSLIGQLALGPVDIVGDIHGEFTALNKLMHQLGYSETGLHPERRQLVFVGDLIDRGPESPAVVSRVQQLVNSGRAQCILGNHELNVLLGHQKAHNRWFFSDSQLVTDAGQAVADESIRQRQLSFFRTLPLALERSDLRVVHACWRSDMIAIARQHDDTERLFQESADRIKRSCATNSELDELDVRLCLQNQNPIKLITSGPESRSSEPQTVDGEQRFEQRVRWWEGYDQVFCVFGHYSIARGQPRGNRHSFCIDYGIGKRSNPRNAELTEPSKWEACRITVSRADRLL